MCIPSPICTKGIFEFLKNLFELYSFLLLFSLPWAFSPNLHLKSWLTCKVPLWGDFIFFIHDSLLYSLKNNLNFFFLQNQFYLNAWMSDIRSAVSLDLPHILHNDHTKCKISTSLFWVWLGGEGPLEVQRMQETSCSARVLRGPRPFPFTGVCLFSWQEDNHFLLLLSFVFVASPLRIPWICNSIQTPAV